VRISILKESL